MEAKDLDTVIANLKKELDILRGFSDWKRMIELEGLIAELTDIRAKLAGVTL